ncbi:MAG: hypothetical protein AAFN92_07610, partial [Bacteroidota bacterium]
HKNLYQALVAFKATFNALVPGNRISDDIKRMSTGEGYGVYLDKGRSGHRFLGVIFALGGSMGGDMHAATHTVINTLGAQTLYASKTNHRLQFVRAQGNALVQRYVYRSVTAAESQTLLGSGNSKNLGARLGSGRKVTTPFGHVANAGAPSDFTSATTTEGDIYNRVTGESFNKSGKIKIDLLHIHPDNIFPLTTVTQRTAFGFSEGTNPAKDAHATREVLIKANLKTGVAIPREAIVEFKSADGQTVNID